MLVLNASGLVGFQIPSNLSLTSGIVVYVLWLIRQCSSHKLAIRQLILQLDLKFQQ